jgi:hypothetical protein
MLVVASDMCTPLSSGEVVTLEPGEVRTRSRTRKPSIPAASNPNSSNEIPRFLNMTIFLSWA